MMFGALAPLTSPVLAGLTQSPNIQELDLQNFIESARVCARNSFDGIFAGHELRKTNSLYKNEYISVFVDIPIIHIKNNRQFILIELCNKLLDKFVDKLMATQRLDLIQITIADLFKPKVIYLPKGEVWIDCRAKELNSKVMRVWLSTYFGV